MSLAMESQAGQDTLYHCMKDYKHGPNSRMSITFNSSKGLTNAPGQNNCFLNSAVQVLWHLDAFRRSFRLLSGHSCMGNACIFCALKVMFTQFQYSDKQVLPPDALRQALSETFQNQQRFQMGYMDDAAECFENILTRIHNHISPGESEDCCTVAHCLPHRKFSMSVSEQVVCGSCGAKSQPFTFNEMVFYVSTGALVTEFKSHTAEELSRLSFSQLLKSTVSKGDVRACPVNCGEFGEKRRYLTNIPDVVSIGLVWESAKSGGQHIRDVVNGIGTTLDLSEMFHSTPLDGRKSREHPLQLVGVVCYYGKHYSTFFFHSKVHEWIYFDDASVKQISSSWSKVCEKLCKGRHQPLLLLYMNPNTDAVDVSSAPKFSTMAPGYEWKNEVESESINARTKAAVPEPISVKASRERLCKQNSADTRYDGVDALHSQHKNRRRHYSEKQLDGQRSTALSRQDSGVSTQSSKSQTALESDSASRVSAALTQHSSDSGSAGHDLPGQESDTASSYCSRSSMASTFSTLESEDTGYAGLTKNGYENELQLLNPRLETSKLSPKKKRIKNQTEADLLKHHSKSQASLLAMPGQSYDDSSLPRDKHDERESDKKSLSYATLPRKKRGTTAPVNPVRTPEINCAGVNGSADDNGIEDSTPTQSITSRIQMFNGINAQSGSPKSPSKPPELKPLFNLKKDGKDGEGASYISRTSVEKILNQQKKASRLPAKMLRPTYQEQTSLSEQYASDNKKSLDARSEPSAADNHSIGSLKDSGYKSLGSGSNSASSVSSFSTGSPTLNTSFTFDTKEHIYYEPPPILFNCEQTNGHISKGEGLDDNAEEYQFPPPPPELLAGGNHSKQHSEASILSDASTLRQRKTPSVESLDALPNAFSAGLEDSFSNLSTGDAKLKSLMKSADACLEKSREQEELHDINSALGYCQQSLNLFNSVLNQRPDDRRLQDLVQSKYDYCMNRMQALELSLTPELVGKEQSVRQVMAELHIDNQTKRGTASSDYTPLHNAIHRAPAVPVRDSSQRFFRTDSQGSSSSATSGGHSSVSQRSNSSTPTASEISGGEKPTHTVPPRLQHSISQLQQKQQHEQNQLHRLNSHPVGVSPQKRNTNSNLTVQSQQTSHSLQSYPSSKPYPIPQHCVREGSRHSSSSSADSESLTPNGKPHSSLYKEVNIPTTLQRMDYIRDGYKSQMERPTCPSPSVIPPPKEFQESSTPVSASDIHYTRSSAQYKQTAAPSHGGQSYSTKSTNGCNGNTHMQPTESSQVPYPRSTSHGMRDDYIDLPPKQVINKQNIRELLVQDMLKRKGHGPATNSASPTAQQCGVGSTALSLPSYADDFDEPLWTPPQRSAYDRGLSHYDKPNYQRQNMYGQVNSRPAAAVNRYPVNSHPQKSLYGENPGVDPRRPAVSQRESRINHCHTYSTEL